MSTSLRFLIGFASGIAALVLGLALLFVVLDRTDRLKAPAFANRLSFDEKLRHLRATGIDDPRVLLVGSSTTLHGVDGGVLEQELGLRGAVANLGVQDLRINQVRFLTEVFLAEFERVDHIAMVSTLLDFKDCTSTRAAFFNPEHVMDYLNGGSELYYHFKYLDIEGVLERAGEIEQLRATRDDLESVSFDAHGSLLLDVPRDRISERVWQGDPITLDPACYDQLRRLAHDLEDRGIRFTYVVAPMRPGYLAERDPDGRLLARHRRELATHLNPVAVTIDAHAALDMPEEAFFDAYHLNRDKAKKLTRYVGERMTAALDTLERRVRPAAARLREPAEADDAHRGLDDG